MSEPFIREDPESSMGPGHVPEAPHKKRGGVEPSPFRRWLILLGLVIAMGAVIWIVFMPLDVSPGADGSLAWCGDGIVEGDEQCDGSDMTQCLDTQECHDCQCVYVVGCGNGIVEGDEECDGSDMTQCLDVQECHDCRCVYVVEESICGDGFCDTATENTDLCPEDCVCVDNAECEPGEGFNCADCGDPIEACGTPCEDSETCLNPLSCFDGVCWEACLCGRQCGGGEGECWCSGYDLHCSDGTVVLRGCYP